MKEKPSHWLFKKEILDSLRSTADTNRRVSVALSGPEGADELLRKARTLLSELANNKQWDQISGYTDACIEPARMVWFKRTTKPMIAADMKPATARAEGSSDVPFASYDAQVARNRARARAADEASDRSERRHQDTMREIQASQDDIERQTNQRHYEESQRRQEQNQRDLIDAVRQQQYTPPPAHRSPTMPGFRFDKGIFN